MSARPPRLITIPPSLEAEVARWAMDRFGMRFEEEPHSVPILPRALKRAGAKSLPALVSEHGVFNGTAEIAGYAEKLFPDAPAILPEKAPTDGFTLEVALEFGPATRSWAYFHLLPQRSLMVPVFTRGIPWWEKALVVLGYRLIAHMMGKGLSLSAEGAEASATRAREIMDLTASQLADGRRYLLGERFSLVDIIFAVQASPMIVPEQYGGTYPARDELPDAMQSLVAEMRDHPAGKFVLRMYAEERNP